MLNREYIKSDGKVYEVVGKDGMGYPVCVLTAYKEIPEDKPLKKTEEAEEEKPKRGRKKA